MLVLVTYIILVVHYGDEDYANRKVYSSKSTADAKIVNTDGRNGAFNGASVVSE